MLITDLSKVKGVTIVEREKLEKLLQEIKLGQSKVF
jgi:curli biogenesis system outer membrane secretion channel CsgG